MKTNYNGKESVYGVLLEYGGFINNVVLKIKKRWVYR